MSKHDDPRLRELLAEAVGLVMERLPRHVDPEQFLSAPDSHREALTSTELCRELGWIEGVADALDVTVLELLDAVGIVVAR